MSRILLKDAGEECHVAERVWNWVLSEGRAMTLTAMDPGTPELEPGLESRRQEIPASRHKKFLVLYSYAGFLASNPTP